MERKQKLLRIATIYNGDSLQDLIEKATEAGFALDATVIESDEYYGAYEIELYGIRPETDAEMEARAEARLKMERIQYLALKKKFESSEDDEGE